MRIEAVDLCFEDAVGLQRAPIECAEVAGSHMLGFERWGRQDGIAVADKFLIAGNAHFIAIRRFEHKFGGETITHGFVPSEGVFGDAHLLGCWYIEGGELLGGRMIVIAAEGECALKAIAE